MTFIQNITIQNNIRLAARTHFWQNFHTSLVLLIPAEGCRLLSDVIGQCLRKLTCTIKSFYDLTWDRLNYLILGADYMSRVVPACRVDSAKRVDYEIAITCTRPAGLSLLITI